MNNDRIEGNKNFSVTDSPSSSLFNNLINNNNNNNNSPSLKVVTSANLHVDVVVSGQKFARWANMTWSGLVEKSLIEYMLKHHSELPVKTTFNISIHEDKSKQPDPCTVAGCKSPRVAKALYLLKSEEYFLCAAHLSEFRNRRKEWKILKTFD